ncbi:DUF5655 domain-containing protein [Kiloniella majae]|uniref:DUF5655 domain-containing protein n=1 Tax=Kiloniella majae TaxID=1938558 RepID=UPI000A27906F|nr:DUF5655 domain-containing protein [Kiloniella majae]
MSEENIKVHCGKCVGERNHQIIAEHKFRESDDEHDIWMDHEYLIVQCLGCDHIGFLDRSLFSEDIQPTGYDHKGEVVYKAPWSEKLYPPPLYRRKPEWFEDLPDPTLQTIFGELYNSLQSESHFLATFGARTVLDRLIILKVGDKGNFYRGIRALQDEGLLSEHEKDILQPTLEAGHAAAHRGYTPTSGELKTVLDTIESLVHRILVLPARAELLMDAVPARGGKKVKDKDVPTVSERIEKASKDVKNLCETVMSELEALGDDVVKAPKKYYIAFRRSQNFVSLQIKSQKKIVVLYLKVDPDEVELEEGFSRDVRAVGHYGTGDLEVLIRSKADLKKAKELIQLSYDNS